MTMPHLMNCPHCEDWCLDCVKTMHDALTAAAKRLEELEGEVQHLNGRISIRDSIIASLTAERDRLRAYAECMKCWREYCHEVHEDKSDWSKTLRHRGWNPSACGPFEFMDSILDTALSAKGEINE